MGLFKAKLTVWNPSEPQKLEEFEVWVDTGAGYSWLSRERLEALGIKPVRRMQFQTIEGRLIERELAPVFVRVDAYAGGDTVVFAERSDSEVMGAHTMESLGLAADPVQKKLVPTVGLALAATVQGGGRHRQSQIVCSVDAAIESGRLKEPFSNEDFRAACPGFGKDTYNAFLWKHKGGNPGGQTEWFVQIGQNSFRKIRE